jgi:hypothetical protein
MERECRMHGERRNAYRILVGKPEGKRPLGRLTCTWEYNIKIDLIEKGWGVMNWIICLRIGTDGGLLLTRQ